MKSAPESHARTYPKSLTSLTPLTPLTPLTAKGVKGVKEVTYYPTAQALLNRWEAAGFTFMAHGVRLTWRGPANVLTDGDRATIRALKSELLAALQARAPASPVEAASSPAPQVLAASPEPEPEVPQVLVAELFDPEAARVHEITRPDIREPLGLAPLDIDAPEVPPLPGCRWCRDIGVWEHRGGVIPTRLTRPNWLRYHQAKALPAQPREALHSAQEDE